LRTTHDHDHAGAGRGRRGDLGADALRDVGTRRSRPADAEHPGRDPERDERGGGLADPAGACVRSVHHHAPHRDDARAKVADPVRHWPAPPATWSAVSVIVPPRPLAFQRPASGTALVTLIETVWFFRMPLATATVPLSSSQFWSPRSAVPV